MNRSAQAFTRACKYTHTHARARTHTHACTRTQARAHAHTAHASAHTQAHTHTQHAQAHRHGACTLICRQARANGGTCTASGQGAQAACRGGGGTRAREGTENQGNSRTADRQNERGGERRAKQQASRRGADGSLFTGRPPSHRTTTSSVSCFQHRRAFFKKRIFLQKTGQRAGKQKLMMS